LRQPFIVHSLASNSEVSSQSSLRDSAQKCDIIDSLSVDASPETTGVTTILQEACQAVDVLGKHYVPLGSLIEQPELQDLKEYFRRPRVIARGVVPVSSYSTTFWDFAAGSLFSTYFPQGANRLLGVYGVRFKLVFTLQVSATPFHQGVLCLNWQYEAASTVNENMYNRGSNSATSTNLPHVRLDLSTNTSVQLSIPYLNSQEYLLPTGGRVYGLLGLTPILAVPTVTGLAAPTYQLLVHLEEMELIGARPEGTSVITVQSGRSMKPMNVEFENEAYPFSSGLSALSRSVKWISKGVPMISSIAGPASWFLEKTSGAVRSFGYSKPQIQEPPHVVHNVPHVFEANTDMPSATAVVGPFASNQMQVTPAFAASDVDEMAFSYILGQWSQICVSTMATTDATGSIVYTTGVGPSFFWFRDPNTAPYGNKAAPLLSGSTANSFIPSHVFFLASMFRNWRGGFRFRFTFGKTKMHGGRVCLCFNPTTTSRPASDNTTSLTVASAPSGIPQPFGHSVIFDLKDGNVFEFEVPYVTFVPYLSFDEMFGTLVMYVMDPLQAPSMVADKVDFLVEVCCMPSFELAVPRGVRYPVNPYGEPKLQSARILGNFRDDISSTTMGEVMNSVKQLIMIPKKSIVGTLIATPTIDKIVSRVLVMPYYYQRLYSASVPGPVTMLSETFGYGGNLASCYLYARGSTDAHVYMSHNSAIVTTLEAFMAPGDGNLNSPFNNASNPTSCNLPCVRENDTAGHFRFPAMQPCLRILSSLYNGITWQGTFGSANATPTIPSTTLTPNAVGMLRVSLTSSTVWTEPSHGCYITVSRAAGDDAMLGHYMGPPPLSLPSINVGFYDPDSETIP
jgi:hypothetical protein